MSSRTGQGPRATARSEQRRSTFAAIKRASRSLLVDQGAEAVRLRAIARALGITAPALYRYVGSHEELMELLTDDIYEELTATVEQAAAQVAAEPDARTAHPNTDETAGRPTSGTADGTADGTAEGTADGTAEGTADEATQEDPRELAGRRLSAAARAFRRWALDHPREFGLVFAGPIPSSPSSPSSPPPPSASPEQVRVAGGEREAVPRDPGASVDEGVAADTGQGVPESSRLRFAAAFGRIFVELWNSRPFPVPAASDLPDPVAGQLAQTARDLLPGLGPGAAYVFVWCWARLYGAVCLEVFGHLDWALDDGEFLFEQTLADLRARTAGEP